MNTTEAELSANFDAFSASWKVELPKSLALLSAHKNDFLKSYAQIASLNSWRNDLLDGRISPDSLEFFAEALNDALVSHVFAQIGSWRSALMSLRSCIENIVFCLYYKDHPVELRLWQSGKHKPGFTETIGYLERHPDMETLVDTSINGIAQIKEEYSTLSRAVHASAKGFRMSGNAGDIILWKPEPMKLSQWRTREKHTLAGLNLLLASMFRVDLSGTQRLGLRKALAIVIPNTTHPKMKKELGITLPVL